MTRELSCRGKAIASPKELDEMGIVHQGGWVFGAYVDGYIVSGVVEATDEYIALEQWCAVDPETVGQFIGLKDANDRQVYERDILRFTYWYFDGNHAETEMVGEVTFIAEEASYGLAHIRNEEWLRHIGAKPGDEDRQSFSGWEFSPDDMEVIGNAIENPELLVANV